MLALLQRVTNANVQVSNQIIGKIGQGLLVFIGVQQHDTTKETDRLLQRILGYRIFSDEKDRMNLSLQDIKGELLLVPQFTLAADTSTGKRPSFSSAADPEQGEKLFHYLTNEAKKHHPLVQTGQFGAYMQVHLCNDGPATFLLKI